MYKNKNLIYVNGKPYREQDLQDMIDYYRENYKPDITLPSHWNEDVSGQVFKNYPFYPAISKSTYRPELYYDKNCQLDISFKEFLDYLTIAEPAKYTIMLIEEYDDVGVVTRLGYVVQNTDSTYTYKDYYIIENDININDYTDTKEEMIKFIINQFNGSGKNQELWYDLLTVENIYNRRKRCTEFNNTYAIDMTINYAIQFLSKIPKIINQKTFIIYYSYCIYLLHIILMNDGGDALDDINNYIQNFAALLDNGIPENVNEMNELLEDYVIQDIISIDKKTSKIIFDLTM
jgi:hypothetical protein